MKTLLLFIGLAFSILVSCSESVTESTASSMTAQIAKTKSFVAEKVGAERKGDFLIITGEMQLDSQKIIIAIRNPKAGDFFFKVKSDTTHYASYSVQPSNQVYNTYEYSGSCKITKYESGRVEGTFQFGGQWSNGTNNPIRTVDNGDFKISY